MGWLIGLGLKWANPAWGLLLTAFQAVVWVAKKVVAGTFSFLRDPTESFAVFCLCIAGFVFGVIIGFKIVEHRIATIKAQLANIQAAGVKHDKNDAHRAAAALSARVAAETLKRAELEAEAAKAKAALALVPLPPVAAVPAAVPVSEPKRVRTGHKVRANKPEPGVWGDIQADIAKLYGQ